MPSEPLLNSAVLLWIFGTLVAFLLLIGSMSRRRFSLTELLRGFVKKHQSDFEAATKKPATGKPDSVAAPGTASSPESPDD